MNGTDRFYKKATGLWLLGILAAVVGCAQRSLNDIFDLDSMAFKPADLGSVVMMAESSSSVVKKSSYPKNKWTLLKRYPDEFKLKGASMVSFEDKLIIFGGCRPDLTCSNAIYSFNILQEALEEVGAIGDKPAPRQGHCVVVYGEEMIVFGGSNEIGVLDDIFVFDMKYVKFFEAVLLEKNRRQRSSSRAKVLPWMRS